MFNLADYEPVEVRLEKFIKDYPDFRIFSYTSTTPPPSCIWRCSA